MGLGGDRVTKDPEGAGLRSEATESIAVSRRWGDVLKPNVEVPPGVKS